MAIQSASTIFDALGFSTKGDTQSPALQQIARTASASLLNNPRDNPVMAEPPAITSSASANGALTNQTVWNAATAGVFNFYGGLPTSDGVGGVKALSATVAGVFSQYIMRVHTVADCLKLQFKIICNNVSTSIVNFIVDGQYVSNTVTTPGLTGVVYVQLDFTNSGGRAVRNIVMEVQNCSFISCSVLPTETLNKPGGIVRSAFFVGDSLTATGGMSVVFNGYAQVLGDILGIPNLINGAIGGTGYLTPGASATFRNNLSDVVRNAPDILFIAGGRNDIAFSANAVTTEVLAYLTAIRQQRVLANVPIIVLGILGTMYALSTTQPTETAIGAAVAAFNDPLTFFVPIVTDPSGPIITGTGYVGHLIGDGNADIYGSSDATHPNDAGHDFYARRIADRLMSQVFLA